MTVRSVAAQLDSFTCASELNINESGLSTSWEGVNSMPRVGEKLHRFLFEVTYY